MKKAANIPPFLTGTDTLLLRQASLLKGRRIGLVTHSAAINSLGAPTVAQLLANAPGTLTAILSPEHGFSGIAGAGEKVKSHRDPTWKVPILSLYGNTRKPTPAMLKNIDLLVFDLQDIAARPYTYVSTLRNVMEAAAESQIPLIVADRPVPLPNTIDGPLRQPGFESFVSQSPLPMNYGMPPGETALWLAANIPIHLDLHIARMSPYHRESRREPSWPAWIPPSPAMLSWESAWCYTATVFTEAFTNISCGRRSILPFQVFAAPDLNAMDAIDWLQSVRLPGVAFYPHTYAERTADGTATDTFNGVRIVPTDPDQFRPATTSIAILSCLQKLLGPRRLWHQKGARPDFFDLLYGTDSVRLAIQNKIPHNKITAAWARDLRAFQKTRTAALLYT